MNWSIGFENKLLINGRSLTPIHPWSKRDLVEALVRLQEKIRRSGHPIIVKAIFIEPHVATGLWNEGSITLPDLQNATEGPDGGIQFLLDFDGDKITVCIQQHTYSMDYDFIVSGHPEGHVRVRDIPDALAVVSEESSF